MTGNPIPLTDRLRSIDPVRPALRAVSGEQRRTINYGDLVAAMESTTCDLESAGARPGMAVVTSLPATPEHIAVLLAAWNLGCTAIPVDPSMSDVERDRLLALAAGEFNGCLAASSDALVVIDRPDPAAESPTGAHKAIASGGSTGRPKLIIDPSPVAYRERMGAYGLLEMTGWAPGGTILVVSPLHHTAGLNTLILALFDGCTVVIPRSFDAAEALELVDEFAVNWTTLTPTHMLRMARAYDDRRDLSSISGVLHSAAPCPAWLKRRWIELLGASRLHEVYGSTEGVGATYVSGEEWLERPGTVGRGVATDIVILDDDRHPVRPGDVGEIFMRLRLPAGAPPTFRYAGATSAETTTDGFVSIGDLGWLDDDGYLYIADRRTDLVISGGVNVYPAAVEAALSEHPGVADVVVIGRPDDEWGRAVHAVVQPAAGRDRIGLEAELRAWCRDRLGAKNRPKTYEFRSELPRTATGKIRRAALAEPPD